MLNISCNLLNTVLTVKAEMVVWVQSRRKCISCLPSWLHVWLGAVTCCHCPASQEKIVPHMASLGKDPNSKFEVLLLLNLYCFCIIVKSKNHKLKDYKLGTVCTWKILCVTINSTTWVKVLSVQPMSVSWFWRHLQLYKT